VESPVHLLIIGCGYSHVIKLVRCLFTVGSVTFKQSSKVLAIETLKENSSSKARSFDIKNSK
jgi:hypothetical protein